MKKTIALALACFCLALTSFAAAETEKKTVLVSEKMLSKNTYRIVARGYPRPGLTDKKKIEGTAKEAAILNAQLLARDRFIDSFDVIQNGKIERIIVNADSVDVWYLLSWPNIKLYLKK